MTQEDYEKDLKRIQDAHMKKVWANMGVVNIPFQPCMHDQCTECHGTGVKLNGDMCVHGISCPCPKCTPRC